MLPSDKEIDQAAGLRRMAHPNPVRVVAITSGKGGVGKTSVSVNLAVAMAKNGKRVMIMDADLGLANIDVMLGLHTQYNLSHVLQGQRKLEEVIVTGPSGIRIVPAASGIKRMAELRPAENAALVNAFSELGDSLDVLLIDTSGGINDSVISFSRAAQDVIVVVCDEPASITDAYALIKLLSRDFGVERFRILSNMVADLHQGRGLFRKVSNATDRFLDVCLDFMGVVPSDDFLRKAVQRQRAVVENFPGSKSAMAFRRMAKDTEHWPRINQASGQLQFFLERLIQTDVGFDVTESGVTV